MLLSRGKTVYKAQPVPAPDTPRKQKANAHLSCSIEGQSECGIRPFLFSVPPLLHIDLFRIITNTTVASNCPALHIPGNCVDPTRGVRPFPRSSHAFNYRKGKGLGTRLGCSSLLPALQVSLTISQLPSSSVKGELAVYMPRLVGLWARLSIQLFLRSNRRLLYAPYQVHKRYDIRGPRPTPFGGSY